MTEMLGKVFVKIQHQDNANSYAGCGFFIDTEHIVTCAHVLNTVNGDKLLEKGQTFKVDMPFCNKKDLLFELLEFVPVKKR